jgi:hypothetical protein
VGEDDVLRGEKGYIIGKVLCETFLPLATNDKCVLLVNSICQSNVC